MEFRQGSPSLYRVLGVCSYSSDEEIRRAYLKLAMQWHPDKWTRNPSLLGEAKQNFQKIQEAYSVLSNKRKRRLYDAGLYGPAIEEEDEVEGFPGFLQEMASLINDARKEVLADAAKGLQYKGSAKHVLGHGSWIWDSGIRYPKYSKTYV